MSNEKSKKSNGHNVYAKVKFRLTDRNIDNIMFGFLVSGFDKIEWVANVMPKGLRITEHLFQHITAGGTLIVQEAQTGKKYELDKDSLLWGFRRYLENTIFFVGATPLLSQYDVADKIIQYTIFKEVRYE